MTQHPDKLLFVAMDDDKKAHLTWCADRAAVRQAVRNAVYFGNEELDDDGNEQVDGITDGLIAEGSHHFEGDAPLYLYRVPNYRAVPPLDANIPAWFGQFLTNVCELPDRNSPEDEPEAVVATIMEMIGCAANAIEHIGQGELDAMTRMFNAACADLGAIHDALKLPADQAGGAAPIIVAIEGLQGFKCAARAQGTAGGNDPAECDWPACGCDERAMQVIESLQESGNLALTKAAGDVLRERERHVTGEGFTAAHDDERDPGVLASGAASYAFYACDQLHPASQGDGQMQDFPPSSWPYHAKWWKPVNPRVAMVKAAAMLIAEIEKLDRAAARAPVDVVGDESHHSHLNGGSL